MSRTAVILFLVLACALWNQLCKVLFDVAGIPNLVAALKDILIIWLFTLAISYKGFWRSNRLVVVCALFVIFFLYYVAISALEGKSLAGLYYARLYCLPIIFFLGCSYVLSLTSEFGVRRMLTWFLRLNLITVVLSFVVYAAVLLNPSLRALLLGGDVLATAWYLGGAGQSIIRMGLPFASPNGLGSALALSACLLLVLVARNIRQKTPVKGLAALLVVNAIALSLTFSRSAILLFFVAALVLVFTPGVASHRLFGRAILIALLLLLAGIVSLYIVDQITEGMVERYVMLNLDFSDPSLTGHADSITDAIGRFDRYYLYGYERGTVGPKAELFTDVAGNINNVENSLLVMIYDLGLFGFIAFVSCYAVLIYCGYKNRLQWGVLIGFLINMLFLPIIFELEVVMVFMFVYLLLGRVNLSHSSGGAIGGRRQTLPAPRFAGTARLYRKTSGH